MQFFEKMAGISLQPIENITLTVYIMKTEN